MELRTATIDVALGELIDNNLDDFLDTISERAFGTTLVREIDYRAVRVVADQVISLEVPGDVVRKGG